MFLVMFPVLRLFDSNDLCQWTEVMFKFRVTSLRVSFLDRRGRLLYASYRVAERLPPMKTPTSLQFTFLYAAVACAAVP